MSRSVWSWMTTSRRFAQDSGCCSTRPSRSVVRIVEAADQSLCLGGHEVSLQHEDIDSQLIEFSRPDERRELAAV